MQSEKEKEKENFLDVTAFLCMNAFLTSKNIPVAGTRIYEELPAACYDFAEALWKEKLKRNPPLP